ncbi:universal stress protein [Candidatus Acetothermia bacterium]|nr:universal stress protein [Candidatus Acetothermia bacterium]
MFHRILVANDGSDYAVKALRVAVDLAQKYRAELHQLSVEEHLPHYAATVGEVLEKQLEEERYFERVAEESKQIADQADIKLMCYILPGHEVETIVRFAEEHKFDLLVIGHVGHSKIWRFRMGSTASRIADSVKCSLLVVQ